MQITESEAENNVLEKDSPATFDFIVEVSIH